MGDELEFLGDFYAEFEQCRQASADRRVGEDEEPVGLWARAPEGFHRLVTEVLGHHYGETLTAGALRPSIHAPGTTTRFGYCGRPNSLR